ncbi:MAG: riboflavin kinase/FMN adenylyltransferase [Lentimonas sp.]|jgi:riboflavin kinase/FMN adenylyltransferase
MQLIRNFGNIKQEQKGSVLTIGNFDGVHLGHQEILSNVRKIAGGENIKSALLTFEPHPLKIIKPDKIFNQRLISLAQKLSFLRSNKQVDMVFLASFNQKLANLSAEGFVEEILVNKLNIKHLIVGYDFIFGKDRRGDASLLQKLAGIYNFSFHQIAAKNNSESETYSSTKIRNLIKMGNIKVANQMLGRSYEVAGIIIPGKKLARTLGFPTANFLPKPGLIKLKFGVYKITAKIGDKEYSGILNFGIKPTFESKSPIFEAHIFKFNQEIYGRKITVKLQDFIREERKFDSIEDLKEQIKQDIDNC